ncbi:MAG: hypothetical protein LIO94_07315 [Clostridiales bacterium]|nr:hypothetical protein [Clostridiales bacterium]
MKILRRPEHSGTTALRMEALSVVINLMIRIDDTKWEGIPRKYHQEVI